MVEATRVELVSEKLSASVSPGAVVVFGLPLFPPIQVQRQTYKFGSFIIHRTQQSLCVRRSPLIDARVPYRGSMGRTAA